MQESVLVTYGSWAGSTAEVAEAIGERLRVGGNEVDVLSASEINEVSSYRMVVLGAAVRAGRPHRDAVAFARSNAAALANVAVALFVVCITMKDDTVENRESSSEFLQPIRDALSGIEPVSTGIFGGAVPGGEQLDTLPLRQRLLFKACKSMAGDWRDWDGIRAWGDELRQKLG